MHEIVRNAFLFTYKVTSSVFMRLILTFCLYYMTKVISPKFIELDSLRFTSLTCFTLMQYKVLKNYVLRHNHLPMKKSFSQNCLLQAFTNIHNVTKNLVSENMFSQEQYRFILFIYFQQIAKLFDYILLQIRHL